MADSRYEQLPLAGDQNQPVRPCQQKKNEARSDSESKQSILILKGNRVETKKRGEISTELKLKAGVHGTNATTQSASISSH